MQPLLLLLFSQAGKDEIEDAVESDDDEDEDVTIVLGLVDSHDEAVPLEENRHEKHRCRTLYHVRSCHRQPTEHKVSHLVIMLIRLGACSDHRTLGVVSRGLLLLGHREAFIGGH